MTMLLQNGWICTCDDSGAEYQDGWVLVRDGLIDAVGDGAAPAADAVVDLGGAVVTPGLVNTHHHLYQTLTRARAQEATLFEWLRELYPVWAQIDAESEYAAARCGLAELALSGCTTVFDHHYVFPRGRGGLWEAEVQAAGELGVRIVASRGSMDLGESDGGLPPDSLVESIDEILADTERLAGLQDADGMVQLAVAPCSPFSVTKELMRESAALRGGSDCACTRTSPRRSKRLRTVSSFRLHACSVPRGARLGSGRCVVRALRAPFGRRRGGVRESRRRRGALPDVEPSARGGNRAGARARRRGRAGGPRRRRLGVERAQRPLLRGQAGAAGGARVAAGRER